MGSRTEVKESMLEEDDPAEPRLTLSWSAVEGQERKSSSILILRCFLAR
jgi:hypothetical protein